MSAVIFEVTPEPDQGAECFEIAQAMRAEVENIDGFISIERFQSLADESRLVPL
ncbi:MAG: antibiotic biosynthesis monooxygenase [Rhodospirillaceae bacterium]